MNSGQVGRTRASSDAQKIDLPTSGKFGRFEVSATQSDGLRASQANAADVGIVVKDTRSLMEWVMDSFWSLLGYDMDSEIAHDKNEALIGLVASGKPGDGLFLVDMKDRVQAFERLFGSNSTATPQEQQDACWAMLKALNDKPEEVNPALLGRVNDCIGSLALSQPVRALREKIDSFNLEGQISKIKDSGKTFGAAVAAFGSVARAKDDVASAEQKEKACAAMLDVVNRGTASLRDLAGLEKVLSETGLTGEQAIALKEAVDDKIAFLKVEEDLGAIRINPDAKDTRLDVLGNIGRFERVCSSRFATQEQKDDACGRLASVLSGTDSMQIAGGDLAQISIPRGISEEAKGSLGNAIDSVLVDHNINVIASGRNKEGGGVSVSGRVRVFCDILESSNTSVDQKDKACRAMSGFLNAQNPGEVSPKDLASIQDTLLHEGAVQKYGTSDFQSVLGQVKALARDSANLFMERVKDNFESLLDSSAEDVSTQRGGLDAYATRLEKMERDQTEAEAFAKVAEETISGNPRLEYMSKSAQDVKTALESKEMRTYIDGQNTTMEHGWVDIERHALSILHEGMRNENAPLRGGMDICKEAFARCETGSTKARVNVAKPGQAVDLDRDKSQ